MTTDFCSWRELADDLTEAQIKYFEDMEGRLDQTDLLDEAQHSVADNHGTRIFFGHLAIPKGATAIGLASNEPGMGWFRPFGGDRQIIGEEDIDSIQVSIGGNQFANGQIDWAVEFLVEGGDAPDDYSRRQLAPAQAPAVAHMLLNAASQIDLDSEPEPLGVVGAFALYPNCADPAQTATLNIADRITDSAVKLDDPCDWAVRRLENPAIPTGPDAQSLLRARLEKYAEVRPR
jgi:hypothetical protein